MDHAGATLYSDTQIKNVSADLHSVLYANPHSVGIGSSSTQDIIERTRYRYERSRLQIIRNPRKREFTIYLNNPFSEF